MRFAIASTGWGTGLNFWKRLEDEGHEVRVYCDRGTGRKRSDTNAHVGEGIVQLEESYDRLIEWAEESADSLVLFDASGQGARADAARDDGLMVVGGGTFCDRLENDRLFGQEIAEQAGANIPPFEAFATLSAVRKRAKTLDKPVFFKADKYIDADSTRRCDDGPQLATLMAELHDRGVSDLTPCILQDKIDGVALSTLRWWNGRTWVGPFEWTIEHKPFMNDDVGPSTGCTINVVWFTTESAIAEALGWSNLAQRFRDEDAPPGPYDINAVIDENGVPWFLEWTPRFGYDAEPTAFKLIDNLANWLWFVGTGEGLGNAFSDELALGLRLSIPPYPWEHVEWSDDDTCVGTRIEGTDGLWQGNFLGYQLQRVKDTEDELEMASPEGLVGLSVATGYDLKELNEEAVDFAKSLRPSKLCFRTDADKALGRDAAKLKEAGIDVPAGLLGE